MESVTLNKYSDLDQLAWMESIDTMLNSIPKKIIFSRKLAAAPWGKWPAGRVISMDAAAAVRELKKEEGKDIVLWGSILLEYRRK